ncbi:MAG: ABC transporter permease subunit [Anaerolineae bacterium]|nr:ABC transporter permease subunit [Thermoflexales bacterium]MDW8053261.1 ABC transporter permease subunit [Anaerolineae bacterium]
MQLQTFPSREALRRLPFTVADVALLVGVLALLAIVVWVGQGMFVAFRPPDVLPSISLDPIHLPYYLLRSTLRMFIALFFSFVFTFVVGGLAARNPYAERILIPALDVLQSVPVLGFLSATVTLFIALFPGSLLGLEAASIFAIFTGQVWNMTFSFYYSLRSLPRDLDEAARLYRLSPWQRFWKVAVPYSMIGLLWNAMMSFGGGWFFVSASEAITVLNNDYTLPGIGAYVAEAVRQQDLRAIGFAVLAMALMIIVVDQLLWRPLVAWADKFKFEATAADEAPRSWLYDFLRTSTLPRRLSTALKSVRAQLPRPPLAFLQYASPPPRRLGLHTQRLLDRAFNVALLTVTIAAGIGLGAFVLQGVPLGEVLHAFGLGALTLLRVFVIVVGVSLVFVPIGVAIGFNPRLARFAQPVVQFLASFPSTFLFPLATLLFLAINLSLEIGAILLMSLGAQWYVLFNVIAGARAVPTELREMARVFRLRKWQLWRRLILPAIFPAWVTGALTAYGGAFNASIVAEVVSWGDHTLVASGIGAYIERATTTGDWHRIVLGVVVMTLYVVVINRLLWRRLYALAERKYTF